MTIPTQFCQDGIDCLSIDDKLDILCADNPINKIIEIVNCNNPLHQNVLLENINSDTMKIIHQGKIEHIDTNTGLLFLVYVKIKDINKIIEEFSEDLDETFINDIQKYLNGGFNEQYFFRDKKCVPSSILKNNISIKKFKKKYDKNN